MANTPRTLASVALRGAPFALTLSELIEKASAKHQGELLRIRELASMLPAYAQAALTDASTILKNDTVTAASFYAALSIAEALNDGSVRFAFRYLKSHRDPFALQVLRTVHAALRLEFHCGCEMASFVTLIEHLATQLPSTLWCAQARVLLRLLKALNKENASSPLLFGIQGSVYLLRSTLVGLEKECATLAEHSLLAACDVNLSDAADSIASYAVRGALLSSLTSLIRALHVTLPTYTGAQSRVGRGEAGYRTIDTHGLVFHVPRTLPEVRRLTLSELLSRAIECAMANTAARKAFFIEPAWRKSGEHSLTTLGVFLPLRSIEAIHLTQETALSTFIASRSVFRKETLTLRRLSTDVAYHYLRLQAEDHLPMPEIQPGCVCVRGLIFMNFQTGDTFHLERSIENALKYEREHTDLRSEEMRHAADGGKLARAKALLAPLVSTPQEFQ